MLKQDGGWINSQKISCTLFHVYYFRRYLMYDFISLPVDYIPRVYATSIQNFISVRLTRILIVRNKQLPFAIKT